MNNFNNSPNLFGMRRNFNRNYNQNIAQPSNCASEANKIVSNPSQYRNAIELRKYSSCCCKLGPQGPKGDPGPLGCQPQHRGYYSVCIGITSFFNDDCWNTNKLNTITYWHNICWYTIEWFADRT